MRKHPFIFSIAATLFFIFSISAGHVLAQADNRTEASYEITLNVVAGSNDPARSDLPQALSGIGRQLRSNFGLTSLKVVDSYVGRIGNNGSISYKSLTDITGRDSQDTPSFLDWQVSGLRNTPGVGPANAFYMHAFRFGARVPVRIGPVESGKMAPVQYEAIGLTVERMTVSENNPVLIGTISLPRTDGRVFLVLTVRPATN